MTDHDLRRRVFEQAEAIALDKGLDRLQAREHAAGHLRYAALKMIEGYEGADPVCRVGRFVVAYGIDKAQYEEWGDEVDWWGEDGPQWSAHRIRIVSQDGSSMVPKVARLMEAIGATFVYHEQDQDPNAPPMVNGVNAYHFIMPNHNEQVEDYCEWLRQRHYQQAHEEQGAM